NSDWHLLPAADVVARATVARGHVQLGHGAASLCRRAGPILAVARLEGAACGSDVWRADLHALRLADSPRLCRAYQRHTQHRLDWLAAAGVPASAVKAFLVVAAGRRPVDGAHRPGRAPADEPDCVARSRLLFHCL